MSKNLQNCVSMVTNLMNNKFELNGNLAFFHGSSTVCRMGNNIERF